VKRMRDLPMPRPLCGGKCVVWREGGREGGRGELGQVGDEEGNMA